VQEVGRRFGSFQNVECKALKEKLVDMEHRGSGRVMLSKFYSGVGALDWPFIESADYLRNLGALDDSDPQRPSVIIANFLSSPSNCESPSGFYSVCCIDECEALLSQVESAVAEPTVSAARLIEVISNLPSDTVAAPRNLSMVQVNRLGDIATHHGGRVPLHGRLFAQWMHHAYPRECRFPHVAGTTNPLTQSEFTNKFGMDTEVSDEELAQHIDDTAMNESVVVELPWMNSEELISSHQQLSETKPTPSTSSPLRILAVVLTVVSAIMPAFRAKKCLGLADDNKERYLV
jgi:diadenosine tetraphosphatase ApaH/serine/threonine PP2A family protein phosphatase